MTAVPFIEAERVRRLADVDAGVVDQNIDAAEFGFRALHHGRDRGLVGDVGDDRDCLGAALLEFGDRRVRFRRVASDDRDHSTGFRQPARHAEPNAAIAAGNDGDAAGEVEGGGCH
jgi:hypothetical protein